MVEPSKFDGATWCGRVLLAGVMALLLGCQPHEVSSDVDSRSAAPSPTLPTKSRATEAVPPKVTGDPQPEPGTADESTGKEYGVEPGSPPPAGSVTESPTTAAAEPGKSDDAVKPPARPVSRRPTVPGEPLEISFDDLVIGMQADVVYRPWMLTERAKEVDGQKVRLVGYVHPGVDKQKHIKELVLLRNLECKFGPGGQADHLVMVRFKPGVEATFTKNAVEVQGILKVNPWTGADGNTWSIYDLDGIAFKDLRRK